MKFVGLALLALNLALVGCAAPGKSTRVASRTNPDSPSVVAPVLKDLTDTRWVLIELDGAPVAPPMDGWPVQTLVFDAAGTGVTGHAGVNRFGGRYGLDGRKLSFGPLALTRRAGPEGQMAAEQRYTQALSRVVAWRQAGSNLILIGRGEVRLALFRPGVE